MVQPQYSPQEALERVKLMMKYDMSKTLNENKEVIFEQAGAGEIQSVTQDIVHYLNGDVQSSDLTNIQNLLDSKVFGQTYKDGTCALSKVLQYFGKGGNTRYSDYITTLTTFTSDIGNDLINAINKSQESSESGFEDIKKDLLDSIKKEINGFCKTKTLTPPKPGGDDKKKKVVGGKASSYTLCTGTYKKGCKTSPDGPIGKVQGCLGLVQDGKFGPKTEAGLKAKGLTSFTDADVAKICAKPAPPKPVVPTGETSVDDVNNV